MACSVVVRIVVARSVVVRSVVVRRVVVRSVVVRRVMVGRVMVCDVVCGVVCGVVNCRRVASTEVETVRHLTADLCLDTVPLPPLSFPAVPCLSQGTSGFGFVSGRRGDEGMNLPKLRPSRPPPPAALQPVCRSAARCPAPGRLVSGT